MNDELDPQPSFSEQMAAIVDAYDFTKVRDSVINLKLQCMSRTKKEFVSPSLDDLKKWAKVAMSGAAMTGYSHYRSFFAEEVEDNVLRLMYVPIEFKNHPSTR